MPWMQDAQKRGSRWSSNRHLLHSGIQQQQYGMIQGTWHRHHEAGLSPSQRPGLLPDSRYRPAPERGVMVLRPLLQSQQMRRARL